MMKKKGFTLAEVLITLAIIGVVATLTLPSLMTNTQEQQALTAFKKIMNSLNEAGQMNAAMEGFDYSSADGFGETSDSIANGDQTIAALINERLQVTGSSGESFGKCENSFVLRDATAICLDGEFNEGGRSTIYVDTNGPKGPNKESTCNSDSTCQDKTQREIYDQFRVTLFRGIADPGWDVSGKQKNESDEAYQKRIAEADGYNAAANYAMGTSKRSNN